jgi:hypothetical protein
MCKIDYSLSIKKIANTDRVAMRELSKRKDPKRCFLHFSKAKGTLYVGVPHSASITAAGNALDRISRLYNKSKLIRKIAPIAMNRAVA